MMDQDENDHHDDDMVVDVPKPNRIRSNSSQSLRSADARSSIPEDKLVESLYKCLMESICQDVAVNMHQLIKTGADDAIPSSWKLFSGTAVPTRRDLYPELYCNGDEQQDEMDKDSQPVKKRKTDSEIEAILNKFAVDLPKSSSPATSHQRRTRDMAEEEEKLRLLSKIQKEKETNYKDSDDEEENETNDEADDDDKDDEDFKMEDDGDDDDDEDPDNKTKNKRSLSTSSETPSAAGPPETTTSSSDNNSSKQTGLDIWGRNPSKEPKNRLCRCQLCGRLISTSRFASHLDKCMGLSTSRSGAAPGSQPALGINKKRNGGSR